MHKMLHLWPTATAPGFELFHVIYVRFTVRATLSKHNGSLVPHVKHGEIVTLV